MPTLRDTLTIETDRRETIRDITERIQKVLVGSEIQDGLVSVFPLHTSSAVFINDSDPNLLEDLRDVLATLVPESDDYAHDRTDPKQNATAHLKSILTGHHVTIPATGGALDMGTYHTIYYAEFDGQRPKEILVKIIGDSA